jgi:hypothetical protein
VIACLRDIASGRLAVTATAAPFGADENPGSASGHAGEKFANALVRMSRFAYIGDQLAAGKGAVQFGTNSMARGCSGQKDGD